MKTQIVIQDSGEQKNIEFEQILIVLGSNGAGKSRFGSFLEKNIDKLSIDNSKPKLVHRITAQKSIQFSKSIKIDGHTKDELRNKLLGGAESAKEEDWANIGWHREQRYESIVYDFKYTVGRLVDYETLLQYLFTIQTEVADSDRKNKVISQNETLFEKTCRIWQEILPKRELEKQGFELKAKIKNSNKYYSASVMSDGERVLFYLIAQTLVAPENSIIVIDEPELHLHKAIMQSLWEKLIVERPDCAFVFMTHDVEFASRINNSKKIWLKEYLGNETWDWKEINSDDSIPEDLLLELIGSRRNVLFVEGETGSWDFKLYQTLFPDYLVVPCGSCRNVIDYTKSFKNQTLISGHIEVFGIIDRDRRNDAEITNLATDNIVVLDVAEVENLFCKEKAIDFIIDVQLKTDEKESILQNCKTKLFERFKNEQEEQINLFLLEELKFHINRIDKKKLDEWKDCVDLDIIKAELEVKFAEILTTQNYDELLKYYNRKNLYKEIESELNLKKDEFPNFLIRIFQKDEDKRRSFIDDIGLSQFNPPIIEADH